MSFLCGSDDDEIRGKGWAVCKLRRGATRVSARLNALMALDQVFGDVMG